MAHSNNSNIIGGMDNLNANKGSSNNSPTPSTITSSLHRRASWMTTTTSPPDTEDLDTVQQNIAAAAPAPAVGAFSSASTTISTVGIPKVPANSLATMSNAGDNRPESERDLAGATTEAFREIVTAGEGVANVNTGGVGHGGDGEHFHEGSVWKEETSHDLKLHLERAFNEIKHGVNRVVVLAEDQHKVDKAQMAQDYFSKTLTDVLKEVLKETGLKFDPNPVYKEVGMEEMKRGVHLLTTAMAAEPKIDPSVTTHDYVNAAVASILQDFDANQSQ